MCFRGHSQDPQNTASWVSGSRNRSDGSRRQRALPGARGMWHMTLTILDPRTGNRVTVTVPLASRSGQRARRWVLRNLDGIEDQRDTPRPAPPR